MFRLILIAIFAIPFMLNDACTTGIISGKFTKDGRPLIFKHRDTGSLQNKLMYFTDGDFDYIGVINSADTLGKQVWMGTNSAGFSIMNSASYNLKPEDDKTSIKDREGIIMKLALQKCETIEDFEELLENLPKPLGVEANFGVIDAQGGAAYYETTNFDFIKIDVNDPKVAPFGYVIRTNYSFNGTRDDGYGYIRYLTAENLLYKAEATRDLSHKFILKKISRSLKHSLLNVDWMEDYPKDSIEPYYIITQDYIPRYSSASTFVCKGVKEGESPELTTMWTILGYQFCSVAVPTWVAAGPNLPKILTADETGNAPLCDMALKLKKKVYPITRGNGDSYLNLTAVVNKDGTGIYQKIRKIEDQIFIKSEEYLSNWYKEGLKVEKAKDFYKWTDDFVSEKFKKEFGFNCEILN